MRDAGICTEKKNKIVISSLSKEQYIMPIQPWLLERSAEDAFVLRYCYILKSGKGSSTHSKPFPCLLHNPTRGLLSMLHSDWLSYYQAIYCNPLVARPPAIFVMFWRQKRIKSSFNQRKMFCLVIFSTNQWGFTKRIIIMASGL